MPTAYFTDTQRLVLEHATTRPVGRLIWFPPAVKGEARRKVVSRLARHGLITSLGDDWQITAEGYDVAGVARPSGMPAPTVEAAKPAPRIRENSKQAAVIQMLQRLEGATIAQVMAETGWQAHTTRGFFAGAIKKKLGLNLVSEKSEGGDRIYRVQG